MRRRYGRSGRAAAAAATAATAGAAAATLLARPLQHGASAWLLAGTGHSRAGVGIRRGEVARRNFFDPSSILPAVRDLLGSPERSLQRERDELKEELRELQQRERSVNRWLLDAMAENKELHAAYQFACASYESVRDELEMTEDLEEDLRGRIAELRWREKKLEMAYWDAGEELEELRPLREDRERLSAELEASEGKKHDLQAQLADAESCKAGLQEVVAKLKGDLAERTEMEELLAENMEAAILREEGLRDQLSRMVEMIKQYEAEARERRPVEAKEIRTPDGEAELRGQLDAAWALPEQESEPPVPGVGSVLSGDAAP